MTPKASWQGRVILKDGDRFELDRLSAINEFKYKMPQPEAEQAAYDQYRKLKSIEGAAFHLSGMKAAHATGNKEAAMKHSLAYGLHMKTLGHSSFDSPPEEVVQKVQEHGSKAYSFSSHVNDGLLVP